MSVPLLCAAYSRGEACGGHHVWPGHAVRSVQEREQDLAPDALQPLSQDQREAWWHQQHSPPQHTVSTRPITVKYSLSL